MQNTFTILGEKLKIRHFPNLYRIYQASPTNLEKQLESLADAWHEGNVVSASQAFESDLAHQV